jgi:mono/diheme cytochrome c family protein
VDLLSLDTLCCAFDGEQRQIPSPEFKSKPERVGEARALHDLATVRRFIAMKLFPALLVFLVATGSTAYAADAMKPSMPGVGQSRPFPQTEGSDLYEAICQACHMPEGAGANGAAAYPALAKNARLKPKVYPITLVLNGSKAMPSFKDALSDEQIAAVVGYVRTHFGNKFSDKISVDDVKGLRR